MTEKKLWVDRTFEQTFPVSDYLELLVRLRRTPVRLAALVEILPASQLVRRDGDRWSIQENAGHLVDVEVLFAGRLDDYADRIDTLRPADVSGRKTYNANHNADSIDAILTRFRAARAAYLAQLEALEPADFGRSAIHPRLQQPMRLCDMLYFQAEHDDHHLSRIGELIAEHMPAR